MQAEHILELQKQLSLLGNPPSNMNGHHIGNESVSNSNTVEKVNLPFFLFQRGY